MKLSQKSSSKLRRILLPILATSIVLLAVGLLARNGESTQLPFIIISDGDHGAVRCMTFSPNSDFLVTAGAEGNIKFWEAVNGSRSEIWLAFTDNVASIALSADGDLLTACKSDGNVISWDLSTKKKHEHRVSQESGVVYLAMLSPRGKFMATLTRRPRCGTEVVSILKVKSNEINKSFSTNRSVRCSSFSHDERTLAFGSTRDKGDIEITLVDLTSGEVQESIKLSGGYPESMAFSPNGELLACGLSDGTVHVWELPKHQLRITLSFHNDAVTCLAFTPDSRILAIGSMDKSASICDISTGVRLASLPHPAYLSSLAISPDGFRLATASGPYGAFFWHFAEVRVWDISQLVETITTR